MGLLLADGYSFLLYIYTVLRCALDGVSDYLTFGCSPRDGAPTRLNCTRPQSHSDTQRGNSVKARCGNQVRTRQKRLKKPSAKEKRRDRVDLGIATCKLYCAPYHGRSSTSPSSLETNSSPWGSAERGGGDDPRRPKVAADPEHTQHGDLLIKTQYIDIVHTHQKLLKEPPSGKTQVSRR